MLFLLSLGVAIGCSKEDTPDGDGQPADSNFMLFKNQTGNPAADALQAQYTSEFKDYKVNFYGTFNADGNPTDINTITYQKTNNDTIVNYILNPVTRKLASSFVTVNNVKSQYVTRYDYPENNPDAVTISIYNYDWIGMSSELLFTANFEKDNNPLSEGRQYMGGVVSNGVWNIGAVAIGVIVAECLTGAPLLMAAKGVAATVIASVSAVTIITVAGIGFILFASSKALANDINPRDVPKTVKQVNNPVNPDNDPTPNLTRPECGNTRIKFVASMDAEGSIMLTGVQGGQGPYIYIVDKTAQDSQVFSGNYPDGSHLVGVVDANGCMGVKVVPLSRDMPTPVGWYVGHYRLERAGFPLDGQSGEIYIYRYNYYFGANQAEMQKDIYYVKSIVPDMPNFYYTSINGGSVGWNSPVANPISISFGISIYKFGAYINEIDTFGHADTFNGPNNSKYDVFANAVFSTTTPSGLTQENLQQINALRTEEFKVVEE